MEKSNDEQFEEQFNIDLNRIKCPYCKVIITDVWECLTGEDDTEIECQECHKRFIITRSISYDICKK